MQDKMSKIDINSLFNPMVIQDMKNFIYGEKNMKQTRLMESQFNLLKKKEIDIDTPIKSAKLNMDFLNFTKSPLSRRPSQDFGNTSIKKFFDVKEKTPSVNLFGTQVGTPLNSPTKKSEDRIKNFVFVDEESQKNFSTKINSSKNIFDQDIY